MSTSIIYKNIFLYRFLILFLYGRNYFNRYKIITNILHQKKSVRELCFGDLYIADFCKKNNIEWTGYDINNYFVTRAIRQEYQAFQCDILQYEKFPQSDIFIIMGSLYHFNNDLEILLTKIFSSTNEIIISEPVKNLSSQKNILGYIAKRSANAGKGEESFRYNKNSLLTQISLLSEKLNFKFEIVGETGNDLVIELKK